MFLKINNLVLGGSSKYKIQAPISGLDMAPIRVSYGDYSGRDGGYVSSQYLSPRTIVIRGFYIAGSCAEADTLRSQLIQALAVRESLPLFVTTFGGSNYVTETYVIDSKMDITDDTSGIYEITLLAPDPFLYDAGDGIDPDSGYIESLFYKPIAGGYTTPYVLPVTWEEGTTATVINNSGDITIFPEIILEGQFTNPKITNETTDKFIELDMTTTTGDVIKIDMKNREITLNGGSVAANRTVDSTWWSLVPGDNSISLFTDMTEDVEFGTIRWRRGFNGI